MKLKPIFVHVSLYQSIPFVVIVSIKLSKRLQKIFQEEYTLPTNNLPVTKDSVEYLIIPKQIVPQT
jgi:hypothetical protein